MGFKFNPTTGKLDLVGSSGSLTEYPADVSPDLMENVGMDVVYNSGTGGIDITIRSADGSAFSASNKGRVAFRNPSLTTVTATTYTVRELTSNLTYTIDSGDTFGLASGYTDYLHVHLVYDNTQGVYVAVSCATGINFDGPFIGNTSSSRTARFGFYVAKGSTTSPGSNRAWRELGYFSVLEATAGTWTQNPTGIFLYQQGKTSEASFVYGSYKKTTSQTIATGLGTPTIIDFNSTNIRTGWTATTGASWAGRITTGSSLWLHGRVVFQSTSDDASDAAWTSGTTIRLWLYIDGVARHCVHEYTVPVDNITADTFSGRITMQGIGEYAQFKPDTYFDFRVEHNDPVSHTILNDGDYNLTSLARWNYTVA